MAKKVVFGLFWNMYGKAELELPDNIDTSNEETVRKYIREHIHDIPIPESGHYLPDSDDFEEEGDIEIIDDESEDNNG